MVVAQDHRHPLGVRVALTYQVSLFGLCTTASLAFASAANTQPVTDSRNVTDLGTQHIEKPMPPADAIAGEMQEQKLEPPVVISSTEVVAPPEVATLTQPITVVVHIRVTAEGDVAWVRLKQSGGPIFDEVVMTAVTHFEFLPATFAGEPVEVEIEYKQTFVPPEITEPVGAATDSVLAGTIVEKGTRRALASIRIAVTVDTELFETVTNPEGKFEIALPHGDAVVEVYSYEHKGFRVQEVLEPEQRLDVRYLIERQSYNPYEVVVIGKRERHVVARTTLRDREIKQVPGTFGDPFRVVSTLPGVGNVISLLAYPIVRGTSPGSTGFLLDGVRVPQLFHMLAGPAVIHPEFIDRVDFYPGSFPVEYGGYTGGIVDGITHRTRADEGRFDGHIDLTNAGLFLRGPIEPLGITGTIAGRYGYPGLLLNLLNTGAYASYWDYQAQIDGGADDRWWRAFAFGSFDELGEVNSLGERTTMAGAQFHRVDLTYFVGQGEFVDTYKLVLGFDQTEADNANEALTTLSVEPRARWSHRITEDVLLHAGVELMARRFSGEVGPSGEAAKLQLESHMIGGGAFAALAWHPAERLLVIPGIRTDVYSNDEATQMGADPRLLWRYRLQANEDGEIWLKGGLGLYHQPPRFLVPLPGFEELALRYGLLQSVQTTLGVEAPLFGDFALDTQVYFNWMDPILFDLSYSVVGDDADSLTADDLFQERVGRSYGIEVLLKHHGRDALFGWLSYTLSWSEREEHGQWVPFDFDRRHMLNLVAGISLPRNWDVAMRLSLQSGRPAPSGGRVDPFYRIDIRIDKRAVWNDWLLDFYVDIVNATLSAERLDSDPDSGLRYTLPTVGFRAVF